MGGRDDGSAFGKAVESGAVKVVEVGMGDQDHVDRGKFVKRQRRGEQAGGAAGAEAKAKADAIGEDGVNEEVEACDAEENGGVADPEGG